jgi:hypothetical protein
MQNELEILKGSVEVILSTGEKVTVKELSWMAALEFIERVAKYAGRFTKGTELVISPDILAELVANSKELAETLITQSTGKDKAWLDKLSASDGLDLLDAALQANLRPDFFDRVKRLGARLQPVLGVARTRTSPPSSTSSSPKGTPATT